MNEGKVSFDFILKQHTEEEIERYEDLKKEIRELRETVMSLVEVWNKARGAITIIKWLAGIAGGVGGFILFIKDNIK